MWMQAKDVVQEDNDEDAESEDVPTSANTYAAVPLPTFWFAVVQHSMPHSSCFPAQGESSSCQGLSALSTGRGRRFGAECPGRLLARGKLLDFIIYQCGHEERTSFAKSNRHILSRTSVPNLSHCFLWVSLCTWLAPVFERSTCD